MPAGARYIYNINFFAGFIVASLTYWALCKISPIPACSEKWMEVGDEIRNVSVAYGAEGYEDDSVSADSGKYKGDEEGQTAVRERQVGKEVL